jgi:hypothetical protein
MYITEFMSWVLDSTFSTYYVKPGKYSVCTEKMFKDGWIPKSIVSKMMFHETWGFHKVKIRVPPKNSITL